MSFKTLLTNVPVGAPAAPTIAVAADVAEGLGAALIGVGAVPVLMIPDPYFGFDDGRLIKELQDQIDADLKAAGEGFRATLRDRHVAAEWRATMADPTWAMVEQSHAADLIVAVRPPEGFGPAIASPGAMLMSSGLPVLVRSSDAEVASGTVMVAWKDTLEARRAVAAGMPFLKRAERVVIAAVVETASAEAAVSRQVAQLAERLSRHGVMADTDVAPAVDVRTSDQLVAIAASQGADLIVAGAYGHTRLRELMFGGVTADLLRSSPTAILFSR